jgi:hypothetical protein
MLRQAQHDAASSATRTALRSNGIGDKGCRWNAASASVLGAIRSAHEAVVGAPTGRWCDVFAVDTDRRGAEKAHRYGFRGVVYFEEANLHIHTLGFQYRLKTVHRLGGVGASFEVQYFDVHPTSFGICVVGARGGGPAPWCPRCQPNDHTSSEWTRMKRYHLKFHEAVCAVSELTDDVLATAVCSMRFLRSSAEARQPSRNPGTNRAGFRQGGKIVRIFRPVFGILGVASLGSTAATPALAEMAKPTVTIVSPTAEETVSGKTIAVTVIPHNYTVECADVGKPMKPGKGHVHAMVDGMSMEKLTNFYCSTSFSISGQGLDPGEHTLAVTLASDDHVDISKPATVKFNYQPTTPQGLPSGESAGKPTVEIVSPKAGAAVPRQFNLQVAVTNFALSCDLEGKSNVAGYGHLHVFVNQAGVTPPMQMMKAGEMQGEMKSHEPMEKAAEMKGMETMAMSGMVSMPCTKAVPVNLSTWKTGKAHVTVMLVNNDHNPMPGTAPAAIDVTVR